MLSTKTLRIYSHISIRQVTRYSTMSSQRKICVPPGPIEMSDNVLQANAQPAMSHVAPEFIPVFGESLKMLRTVLLTEKGQPFVIAGSGTLGWDLAAANLVEAGDDVLVLNTGYFGDSFADCFETYGVKVTQIKAEPGDRPTLDQISKALDEKKFKAISITHVDTSTGVLSDAKGVAELVRKKSPDTLVFLDGVCSAGGEEIRFDEWGIDFVITASQKAIGVPPGLSITMASPRAVSIIEKREKIPAYFANLKRWLPIMQAYEAGKPMYFATPSVQLIYALHTSLKDITARPMEERFKVHIDNAVSFRKELSAMGLKFVPKTPETSSNLMSGIYYPDGVAATDLLPKLAQNGIQAAGGLHKAMATKYFRIGHMGVTATDTSLGHMKIILNAIKTGLKDSGYKGAQ